MMTAENLKQAGANPEEGIARCMGNETFYLKLAGMALECPEYEKLHEAIENNELKKAFEYAHALKGVIGNVSLTNLLTPVVEITESLRHEEQRDYSDLLAQMDAEREKLKSL